MIKMDNIHKFYCSKAWRDLSYSLKVKVNGQCNRCKETILDFSKLIGHHTVELNEDNVDNPDIALNPELIEIICHDCHNKEHDRWQGGYVKKPKKVYIVYGSPLSGKNTMVSELYEEGDIVLDLDRIWEMITLEEKYSKPKNIRFNVFKLRDELLDQIKTRYGNWNNAYIIGGYPDKYERERIAKELSAEMIYIEASKEECIERVRINNRPKIWVDYIEDWWERYKK